MHILCMCLLLIVFLKKNFHQNSNFPLYNYQETFFFSFEEERKMADEKNQYHVAAEANATILPPLYRK